MDLPYFVADTLNVTLYQVKSRLVAKENRQINLGPWRVDLDVDVISDIITGTEVGLWVTLAGKLRLYLIVRDKESWLFVMDEAVLRECGAKTKFAAETLKARVLEIKPSIRGVFFWKAGDWKQMKYESVTGTVEG